MGLVFFLGGGEFTQKVERIFAIVQLLNTCTNFQRFHTCNANSEYIK